MLAVAIPLKKDYNIEQLLRSLAGIQNVIVMDGGSSNDTLKKVQAVSKELGMKLYFYRCSNFNHDAEFKNKLLKICDKYDFGHYLMVDCNQKLSNVKSLCEFVNNNKSDGYEMIYETSTTDGIIQKKTLGVIKNREGWNYSGSVYPRLQNDVSVKVISVPRNVCLIVETYIEKSQTQLKEDKKKLENEESVTFDKIEINIELEEWNTVIDLCNKLELTDKEDIYRSRLVKAEMLMKLDKPWEEVFISLWKAWECMNTVEPLLYIIRYYLDNSNYLQAYTFLKIACEISYPNHLLKYVKRSDYIYERWKLMQVVANNLQKYEEANQANKKLLLLQTTERTQNYYNSLVIKDVLKDNYVNRHNNPMIVIYAGETSYYWYGNMKNNNNLKRIQVCAINLAEEFVKHNHHCIIFCNTQYCQTINNVEYLPLSDYDNFMETYNVNKLIIINHMNKIRYNMNVDNVYVWLQDVTPKGDLEWNEKLKGIIVLTKWHKHKILNILPKSFHYLVKVVSNGVNVKRFFRKKIQTNAREFIYTSDEFDGLEYLLKIFPTIRGKYPDATLQIYSEVTNEKMLDQINNYDYIELHERVDQGILSNKILSADYWLFPTNKVYPCCMTAYEMQAGKVFCLVTKTGCLDNIVNDRGVYIERTEKSIMDALDKVETDSMYKKEILKEGFEWVIEQSWKDMFDIWIDLFEEDEKEDLVFKLNIEIQQNPLKFTILKDNLIFMKSIIQDNVWEYDICDYLRKTLDKESTFIDIGSYVGYQSIYASFFCKQVYTYEIDNQLTEIIQKNVEDNGINNVKIHCVGIGNERKVMSLWRHKTKSPTLYPDDSGTYEKQGKTIKCETLDFLYKNRRKEFSKIIVKINSNCINVLNGAGQFIDIYRPNIIIKNSEKVREFLKRMNYEFESMNEYVICEPSKKKRLNSSDS